MERELTKEEKQKIIDIKNDFYRYNRNNLYIKDKQTRIVKFTPNLPQSILIDYVIERLLLHKPVKAIIVKARQMGLSTAIEAIIYWWTATHKNINSVIIGNDEKSSKNLYKMFRRYYDNSNSLFKPSIRYNTKTDLSFELFDDNGKQIGLGSSIKTETAGNKSAGRSDTVNCLHASELGEWENGEDLVASLLETVPDMEYMEIPSMMFLESTAKGRGNYFHKEFVAAMEGKNNFMPFFLPWWILEEYERDDGELGELSEYEKFLVELIGNGLDVAGKHIDIPKDRIPAKIKFYRHKAKNFESNPTKMVQEYPSTWQEAFVASGNNVFNTLSLQELESQCEKVYDSKYYNIIGSEYSFECSELEEIEYNPNEDPDDFMYRAPLKIWEMPRSGVDYVIGADVAEGIAGGDYSVVEVVNTNTMKTAARWRGHIDPDKFAEVIGALGTKYNYALVAVEVNNHGLTTIQKLRDQFYTNLYKRENGYDEDFEEPTSHMGWKTDMRTKRLMINDLVRIVREHLNEEKDIVFVNEAFAYIRDDRGRTNAETGEHDDTVMAKAIAFQLFDWKKENSDKPSVYIPSEVRERKLKHRKSK